VFSIKQMTFNQSITKLVYWID